MSDPATGDAPNEAPDTLREVLAVTGRVIAVLVSGPAALFVVMLALFVDSSTAYDRFLMTAYVAAVYLVLGLLFGIAGPRTGVRWTPWLVTVGVAVGVWLTVTEGTWLFGFLVLAACIAATVTGTSVGAAAGSALRRAIAARRT